MRLLNLFNKNKRIGTVNSNTDAIKSLSKKKYKLVTSLVLTANIITSVLTGCTSNIKEEPRGDGNTITYPEFDLDKFLSKRLYAITEDEVDLIVTSDYLNSNSYMPIDNVETKHEFIINSLSPSEDSKKTAFVDYLFAQYNALYTNYLICETKDAYYTKKYFEEQQNYYIYEIEKILELKYIPSAMKYDEYIEKTNLGNKAVIEYTVKEGDTLSEIVDKYVSSPEEFQLAIFYAINNNVFTEDDYNILKPGQKLKLAFVGKEDYDLFDLEESEDLFNYICFIADYRNGVKALSGDVETLMISRSLIDDIKWCIDTYESNNYNEEELRKKIKDVINKIYLITGKKYQAPLVNKKDKR